MDRGGHLLIVESWARYLTFPRFLIYEMEIMIESTAHSHVWGLDDTMHRGNLEHCLAYRTAPHKTRGS